MNEKICETIRDRILFLEYEPGQMLNEKELAKEFGVSRTPLREALWRLTWEKLILIVPRGGTMVTPVEFQKLRDVFQTRIGVDGLVGRFAAQNISEEQLARMKNLTKECRNLYEKKKDKELINIDIVFRNLMNDAANNPILAETSDYLYNMTLRVWYLILDKVNWVAEVEEELNEIEETIQVFSKRDPEEAEQFRRNVIRSYVERIRSRF